MRLLPKKTTFFDLFDQETETLVEMATELRDMLRSFDRLAERQATIKALERRGDKITHSVATEIRATFVTPLDKADIATIANGLDDIADYTDAVAVRLVLYWISESSPEARELGELLLQSTQVLQSVVASLRNLREPDRVFASCQEIHRLENECDTVYRRALGRLFNTPGVDPIFVMKWKEIYERIEMAMDKCEDVADVIQGILIEYT